MAAAPGSNGGDAKNDAASEETLTSHLPLDIVEEILCRLPVKHLRQLCCVSKSWNSLISRDSKFAKKHLIFSTSTSNRHRHHLALSSMNSSRELLLTHSPISTIFTSSVVSTTHATQLRFLLNNNDVYYNSTGFSTCDGILCFDINKSLSLLCNPSIRKFKLLPPLKISCDQTLYTLVYDRFINNYKIFALSFFNNNKKPQNFDALDNWIQELPDHHIFHRPPEVNVHILGTDYWRRIRDHHVFPRPGIVMSDGEGIFVSDTVNWLAYDTYSSSQFIVSLDLENESYRKLLPPLCHLQSKTSVSLGVLRDCLSLLTHSDNFDKFFGVWIMKEHRNEESWIKLLSIPHMRMRDYISPFF
jgi:F-box interacting protein